MRAYDHTRLIYEAAMSFWLMAHEEELYNRILATSALKWSAWRIVFIWARWVTMVGD